MTTSADASASAWDAIWTDGRPQRTWPSEDVVRFCARRLEPRRGEENGAPQRVLEVGCGNGANLWFLAKQGYDVGGADISGGAIGKAQALLRRWDVQSDVGIAKVTIGALTLDTLGATGLFDAIIDCRASQHVPWSQHAAAYAGYRELLKPGGWLFLLHLDDRTTDASRNDHLRAAPPEAYTWSDIETGVYPRNGLVCMPPYINVVGAAAVAGFEPARIELLAREDLNAETLAGHVALDARKPE